MLRPYLKLPFTFLLPLTFLITMGCESMSEWKEDFSRAVGWEKAESLEKVEIVIAPPLVLPPNYELKAPESGEAPRQYAEDFPEQSVSDDNYNDLFDANAPIGEFDESVDRRPENYQTSKSTMHPSPSRNIRYDTVNSIFKNALQNYRNANRDSSYSRQYYNEQYSRTFSRDNPAYVNQNQNISQVEAAGDLSTYKDEPMPIGEVTDGSSDDVRTCEKIRKDIWGEYVCVD